jgi:hypothetical protein
VTEPDTNVVTAFNSDNGDTVRLGESGDELLVLGIIAVFSEDTKESLLAVESLADFIESLDETYIERELESDPWGLIRKSSDTRVQIIGTVALQLSRCSWIICSISSAPSSDHQSSCEELKYRHLPQLTWDFLITLLMAAWMLSIFSSSTGAMTGISLYTNKRVSLT